MGKIKNRIFASLIGIILISTLTSCSTLKNAPKRSYRDLSWQQQIVALNAIDHWSLSCSLSIRHEKQMEIATCQWQQDGDDYYITLASPLNIIHLYIIGKKNHVTLWKSTLEKYTSTTPEKLLAHEMNWDLPISNLVYWIKGQPAPNQSYKIRFDNYYRPTLLKQQGWVINYANFISVHHVDLPTKIFLQNGQFKIKIAIRKWQIIH